MLLLFLQLYNNKIQLVSFALRIQPTLLGNNVFGHQTLLLEFGAQRLPFFSTSVNYVENELELNPLSSLTMFSPKTFQNCHF